LQDKVLEAVELVQEEELRFWEAIPMSASKAAAATAMASYSAA
jgi:hypothetical protein